MRLGELVERSAYLDLVAFAKSYPHAALVFVLGGPDGQASGGAVSMDETGEFKTTTKLRLLYPEPARPDRNAPVVFLVKRNTWTPFDDVITVGRATVHDLSLPYDSVSKFHACLTRWPKGWKITDERAVNGTFVDRKQLPTGSSTPIQDGARIGFGPEVEGLFFTPEGLYRFLAAYSEESPS